MPLIDLVQRYPGNPIITPDAVPGATAIFNCGAAKFKDKYILLTSVFKSGTLGAGKAVHVAESHDGINFKVRPESFISAADSGPYTDYDYDFCDPRITYLNDTYYITYPAHKPGYGVVGVLGKTDDFQTFERLGYISLPSNRVPVLFPEKINGQYVRLDRPYGIYPGNLWLSYCNEDTLMYWGNPTHLLNPGNQAWNNLKVGPSGPPIKTEDGWLVLFHAVSGPNIAGPGYYQACMLLDLENPEKIIGMPKECLMAPTTSYERVGNVPNVIFSTGHIVEPDGEIKFYYAGADTVICLATMYMQELVEACKKA